MDTKKIILCLLCKQKSLTLCLEEVVVGIEHCIVVTSYGNAFMLLTGNIFNPSSGPLSISASSAVLPG